MSLSSSEVPMDGNSLVRDVGATQARRTPQSFKPRELPLNDRLMMPWKRPVPLSAGMLLVLIVR
jgi:hypothetical protein